MFSGAASVWVKKMREVVSVRAMSDFMAVVVRQ